MSRLPNDGTHITKLATITQQLTPNTIEPPAWQETQRAGRSELERHSHDDIEDLVHRLNRAIANLPAPSTVGSYSTDLPPYEQIV